MKTAFNHFHCPSTALYLLGFINCSEHMDFATVRKTIFGCLSVAPAVEHFMSRYSEMHRKWQQGR
jgi:hypothetical protein